MLHNLFPFIVTFSVAKRAMIAKDNWEITSPIPHQESRIHQPSEAIVLCNVFIGKPPNKLTARVLLPRIANVISTSIAKYRGVIFNSRQFRGNAKRNGSTCILQLIPVMTTSCGTWRPSMLTTTAKPNFQKLQATANNVSACKVISTISEIFKTTYF